jgi:hypothetical protein
LDLLHTADLEVLLDLLRDPGLVEKSRVLIEKTVVKGLLNDMNVRICTLRSILWLLRQMSDQASWRGRDIHEHTVCHTVSGRKGELVEVVTDEWSLTTILPSVLGQMPVKRKQVQKSSR